MTASKLAQHPLLPWLALQHTQGIGPVRALKLYQTLGHDWYRPEKLALTKLSAEQLSQLQTAHLDLLDPILVWQKTAPNRYVLTWDSPAYPAQLKAIPAAPLILFVEGELNSLTGPQIAVVGSRNPSYVGKENAKALIPDLVAAGAIITSGLALGIDGLSHQAALDAGGISLGVLPALGQGADRVRRCADLRMLPLARAAGPSLSTA